MLEAVSVALCLTSHGTRAREAEIVAALRCERGAREGVAADSQAA